MASPFVSRFVAWLKATEVGRWKLSTTMAARLCGMIASPETKDAYAEFYRTLESEGIRSFLDTPPPPTTH